MVLCKRTGTLVLALAFTLFIACKSRGTAVVKDDPSDSQDAASDSTQLEAASLDDAPQQVRRFLEPLSELDQIFTNARTTEGPDAADVLSASAARLMTMRLEALSALYHKDYKTELKEFDQYVSDLSDQLSVYGDFVNWAKVSQTATPGGAAVSLSTKAQKQKQKFSAWLKDGRWLKSLEDSDNPLHFMRKRVANKIDWPKQKYDRAYVLDYLIDSVKEVQEKSFDLNELENGIHKFRRFERWIFITMQATCGLVQADKTFNPIPSYIAALSDPSIPTKYSTFQQNADIKHPIVISQSLVTRAVGLIEDIGTVKDFGMLVEKLSDALRESSGMSQNAAEAQARTKVLGDVRFQTFFGVGPDNTDPAATDVKERAAKIYKEFVKVINPELLKELKAARED